jgi:hypothetical protein
MIMRFIGAMLCGVLLLPATTTGGYAQAGGYSPPASASKQEITEHVSTVRAEGLYLKCKQQFGVWPETLTVRANNAATGACMRNGGKVPYAL